MGGIGSGRRRQQVQPLVEQSIGIDIRRVRSVLKNGATWCTVKWVHGGLETQGLVRLSEARLWLVAVGQVFEAAVRQDQTPIGSISHTLLCPSCARSSYTLYMNGVRLECRACAGLAYRSQSLSRSDRQLLAAQKLVERLQVGFDLVNARRPKGMWRKTYLRLLWQLKARFERHRAG